uniref:Uncharacterized protein n=1 Tax=Magallana gigas TaxID=29159 RepID=A0A8W8M5F4_MAGGI
MAVTSSEPEKQDEIKELKGMIQQLTTKVSAIEQGSTYKRFEQQPTSWDHKDQQQQYSRGNYQSRSSYDNTNSRENLAYEQQTEPLPRRSQRAKKTTLWITSGDYIVNQQIPYLKNIEGSCRCRSIRLCVTHRAYDMI